MGGEAMLIPAKGEGKKIWAALKRVGQVNSDKELSFEGPEIKGREKYGIWIERRGNSIHVAYQMHELSREWANCLASRIARKFKIKRAGWDAVGYADDALDCMLKAHPFDYRIENLQKYMQEFSADVIPAVKKDIEDFKQWAKIMEAKAAELIP